jgi:hypothetical protein
MVRIRRVKMIYIVSILIFVSLVVIVAHLSGMGNYHCEYYDHGKCTKIKDDCVSVSCDCGIRNDWKI